MTYRQLLKELENFSDEQLDYTVIYYDDNVDEFMPLDIEICEELGEEIYDGIFEFIQPVFVNDKKG